MIEGNSLKSPAECFGMAIAVNRCGVQTPIGATSILIRLVSEGSNSGAYLQPTSGDRISSVAAVLVVAAADPLGPP